MVAEEAHLVAEEAHLHAEEAHLHAEGALLHAEQAQPGVITRRAGPSGGSQASRSRPISRHPRET